jgi:hypothetical protein
MMKHMKNFKTWLVVAAFAGTVLILFGGQALTAKYKVNQPLKEVVLAKKVIRDLTVKSQKGGVEVAVKMDRTANLQSVMDFVVAKTELYHKKPVTSLTISSASSQRLEQVRYQLSFYLEEALASGHYIQLKTALDNFKKDDVKAKVYLADRFIYVQLEDSRNYLYQAVPRLTQGVPAGDTNRGGGSV